ncbi:hypothetical protein [Streptomyces lydicus]|uniref:hypothetical protein n=1 Tax=Streptomyces lydicus TaxID=47763 RepID=UPI0034465202
MGSVINIITSLIEVPDGAEWWVVLGGVLLLIVAGSVEFIRVRQEEERQREEQQREASEREASEREAREREAAVRSVRVSKLGFMRVKGYVSRIPPQVANVNSALEEVFEELRAACDQFSVTLGDSPAMVGVELATKLSDDRWVTIGDNVARLRTVSRPVGITESASTVFLPIGRLTLIPTDESVQSFVASSALIRDQIRMLRQGA